MSFSLGFPLFIPPINLKGPYLSKPLQLNIPRQILFFSSSFLINFFSYLTFPTPEVYIKNRFFTSLSKILSNSSSIFLENLPQYIPEA